MLVGQPKLLKEVNRDIIKDMIFEEGPITKPELAKASNLSLPTVNKIVDGLERDGIVRQDGITGSSSGKKAKQYVANEKAGNMIILYYLNGAFRSCLVNAVGSKIHEQLSEVNCETGELALESAYEAIDELIRISEAEVRAIGFGVPGVVKSDKRITNISAIPGWTNLKLEEVVSEKYQIPVFVENDVKLTTVGYYHTFGQKHDHPKEPCHDMVYIYIGKGIGSGIIINGSLHKGFSSFAGEFGYLAPFEEKEEKNYAQGGGWLEDKIQYFLSKNETGECGERTDEKYIHYIAASIVGYIVTLNPEAVVLQGKGLAENSISAIKEEVKKYIPEESLPGFYINEDEECGINGLINLCMANLSTTKQLVLKSGI